jgi:dihydroorotase
MKAYRATERICTARTSRLVIGPVLLPQLLLVFTLPLLGRSRDIVRQLQLYSSGFQIRWYLGADSLAHARDMGQQASSCVHLVTTKTFLLGVVSYFLQHFGIVCDLKRRCGSHYRNLILLFRSSSGSIQCYL